ncbi:MAG: SDR family NAD(P)-dependent oxidoreductase, partial [Marivita sp.]
MSDQNNETVSVLNLPGLQTKRVAITAGASGIGFTIAQVLRDQGARVAICDADGAALEKASVELGDCLAVQADVSDDVDAFFDQVQARLGGLDALINN